MEGANADGQALAQELDLRFLDCSAALEAILASDTVSALLAQDSALTIAVSGQDEAQCQDLLTQAQHCTAGQETPTASPPAARNMTRPTRPASPWASTGLTWPSTTWTPPSPRRRSKNLTMAEIRDRIQALGGTLPTGAGSTVRPKAGHHGQGHHSE